MTSPYQAALIAANDPDGSGWYLLDTHNQTWNVYSFGPEWVLAQPIDDRFGTPMWYRWENLTPITVILRGLTVGADIRL